MAAPESDPPRGGSIEQFLSDVLKSQTYKEFVQNAENLPAPEDPPNLAQPRLLTQDGDNKFSYDLSVSTAHFLMSLDTSLMNSKVGISYPSRLTQIDHNEIHPLVTGLIDTAYPRGGYTPSVALIGNGREVRLDLSKYWDGKTYELSVGNRSLSAVIYYLNFSYNMPSGLSSMGSRSPDFMYAFTRTGSGWQEFIQMPYSHAQYGKELAAEILPRNSGYLGDNLSEDSENLAQQMREACLAHPPKTLRLN